MVSPHTRSSQAWKLRSRFCKKIFHFLPHFSASTPPQQAPDSTHPRLFFPRAHNCSTPLPPLLPNPFPPSLTLQPPPQRKHEYLPSPSTFAPPCRVCFSQRWISKILNVPLPAPMPSRQLSRPLLCAVSPPSFLFPPSLCQQVLKPSSSTLPCCTAVGSRAFLAPS